MTAKFLLAILLTALTLFVAVTGCAQTAAPAPSTGTSPAAATSAPIATSGPAATSAPAATTAPAADVRRLVVLVNDDVAGLNPNLMRHPFGWEVAHNLYGSLVSYDVDLSKGTYLADKMIPSILESWQVSDDRKTLTIKINPKATFSDGSPVTAEDVLFTFERGIVSNAKWQYGLGGMTSNDQFEKVDERTVNIKFPEPMGRWTVPNFFFYAFGPVSKKFVQAHAEQDDPLGEKLLGRQAMGSGPYVLDSWKPGESLTLKARPDYWGEPKPYYTEIQYRIIPDAQTRLLLIQSGEADIAFNLSPDQMQQAAQNPNLQVISVPAAQDVVALRMNPKVPPFDDIKVRQAVIKAIPYDAIIKDVIFGYGTRVKGLCGVNTFGYKAFDLYDTNMEQAKQLMSESKYASNAPEVELLVPTTLPEIGAAAILIQSSLKEIGINLKIQQLPFNAYFDRGQKKDLVMNIHSMGPWYNDCMYWAYWMFSDTSTNYIGYRDPELDKLSKESFNVPMEDTATYSSMITQVIDETLVKQAITAPLFERNWNVVAKKGIQGIVYWPLQNIEYKILRPAGN